MEVVTSVVGAVVVETGRLVWRFFPTTKNFIRFRTNLRALEKNMKNLQDLRNKVREEVEAADTQKIDWLREVEQIMIEVNSVQSGTTADNEKLCGCFLNVSEKYKFSRDAARLLKEVERLLKAGNIASNTVSLNFLTNPVEHIPGPSIENQTAASKNLDKLMNLLNEDAVMRIGVWGMGGVGKTTLVKNLNNKLKRTSTQQFGMVILATVSKDLDLKRVQLQIAQRLNMEVKMGESLERLATRIHQRLRKEKFLLILDDVWETIDFDCLGVPQDVHMGSKILLTSRSLEICREMETDEEVKVDVLHDDEAWQLFSRNAGKVATLEEIEPVAREVAKECSGLPLAIINAGTAMRGKTMIELWKDALNELRRSVPYIKGIENKLYKPLKWSYDSLQGKSLKSCFLYCSLYPEDFSIEVEDLVKCWLAEGLIDEQQNYEDTQNRGIALIEKLKDSCLLEQGDQEGTVKMHDVVRDVAIWIASSMEDQCKSLVRSGIGLTQISKAEILGSLKRISFMNNRIIGLPDSGICCPRASTLMLQGNFHLSIIPDGFLQAFPSLTVLNIGRTLIKSFPESILQLHDLRVLVLRDCALLGELPQLVELSKLQVLDCSGTQISKLPNGIESLCYLKELNLSRTRSLIALQAGILSRLSSLEVLDMTCSAYSFCVKQGEEDGKAFFQELQSLKRLVVLSIRLNGIPYLGSSAVAWIRRLRRFKFFISPTAPSFPTKLTGRRMIINGLDLSGEPLGYFLKSASSLDLNGCGCLNQWFQMLAVGGIGCFDSLKSLNITNSKISLRNKQGERAKFDLLPNLEEIHLHYIDQLECVSEVATYLGLSLSRLRIVKVSHCPDLKCCLFLNDSGTLEEINVGFCNQLEVLFFGDIVKPELPKLEIIALENLNGLRKICPKEVGLPKLKQVEVINCPKLEKLPLTDQNVNAINEIRGDAEWWSDLEWDGDNTKACLQPFFQPVTVSSKIIKIEAPWKTFRTAAM